MRIYLVQSGDSLDGSDGYSYGLLRGEHHRLLVSFADYQKKGRQTIHRPGQAMNRRKLAKRSKEAP